jgi:hypothetical protein
MNGLKSLIKVMVIAFDLPWMKLLVQRRVFEAEICLGLLQLAIMLLQLLLPLLTITGPMLGLESIQEMQQLKIFVKKMTVIIKTVSKLLLISHYKLIHQDQLRRMNLNQVEGQLLVMVIHFIWMKICCYRSVVSPYFLFCLFR